MSNQSSLFSLCELLDTHLRLIVGLNLMDISNINFYAIAGRDSFGCADKELQ
jgi:hypothetical protein